MQIEGVSNTAKIPTPVDGHAFSLVSLMHPVDIQARGRFVLTRSLLPPPLAIPSFLAGLTCALSLPYVDPLLMVYGF